MAPAAAQVFARGQRNRGIAAEPDSHAGQSTRAAVVRAALKAGTVCPNSRRRRCFRRRFS